MVYIRPSMAPLPIDPKLVDECRTLAAAVADQVQEFIRRHTTVAIERTVLRSSCVERVRAAGKLGQGIAALLGARLARGAADPQEAAEAIAYDTELEPPERR